MGKYSKIMGVVVVLVVLGFIATGCSKGLSSEGKKEDTESLLPSSNGEEESTPEELAPVVQEKPEETTITLVMVGDNLLHLPVLWSGKQEDESYQFDHIFANIKEDVESADIAIINQETILGGTEMGLSEYPLFNSPKEVAQAVNNAGFDVVMQANNHVLDMGDQGIVNTIETWEKYPNITLVGVNKNIEDQSRVRIVQRDGIKVGFLCHTVSLNGLPLPQGKPWRVNLLTEETIRADARAAKAEADFVVALPHWGDEYMYEPSDFQVNMAEIYAEEGVDLVIGTHPHVLEPVQWVTAQNGNKALVYYSLGNFISTQDEAPRMLGGMAKVTIKKTGEETKIVTHEIVPLITHFTWGHWDDSYTVHKFTEYNPSLLTEHSILSGKSYEEMAALYQYILGEDYAGVQVVAE